MLQFQETAGGRFLVPYVPRDSKKTQILLPEGTSERKIVAYKIRLRKGEPWYGDHRRCPYNFDIDQPGQDGVSLRDQIHLYFTGILERAYGKFIWQKSDQMATETYIEEWPEIESIRDRDGRWARFANREP